MHGETAFLAMSIACQVRQEPTRPRSFQSRGDSARDDGCAPVTTASPVAQGHAAELRSSSYPTLSVMAGLDMSFCVGKMRKRYGRAGREIERAAAVTRHLCCLPRSTTRRRSGMFVQTVRTSPFRLSPHPTTTIRRGNRDRSGSPSAARRTHTADSIGLPAPSNQHPRRGLRGIGRPSPASPCRSPNCRRPSRPHARSLASVAPSDPVRGQPMRRDRKAGPNPHLPAARTALTANAPPQGPSPAHRLAASPAVAARPPAEIPARAPLPPPCPATCRCPDPVAIRPSHRARSLHTTADPALRRCTIRRAAVRVSRRPPAPPRVRPPPAHQPPQSSVFSHSSLSPCVLLLPRGALAVAASPAAARLARTGIMTPSAV